MASSNKHWPSMFKSKPCNPHDHQWQHDINPSSIMSTGCHRTPYTSVPECDERSPEPKPRWNPKPEQIRILEAIFNSGMVNPPRDEIRKIRVQLQEYGQVGDANVFYWFQNRKSRSKHRLRNLQNSKQHSSQHKISSPTTKPVTANLADPSSSSSSSEKSSPKVSKRTLSLSSPTFIDASNSPTSSVNKTYFQAHNEFVPEPFFFHSQQPGGGGTGAFAQGFCFSELSNMVHVQDHTVGPCSRLLLSEIMNSSASKKVNHEEKNLKMQPQLCYTPASPVTGSMAGLAPPLTPSTDTSTVAFQSTINQIQGLGQSGGTTMLTVFINDVAFEVTMGPFNVREAFGDDVLLIQSSGQPVLTNECGVTLQSLQHGAFYYLVPFSMSEHILKKNGK
uniref:WUSCHEL-related homeobox 9 n=1 Tax=Populus tomentosa TaxID=118781 RepID=A0A1L6K4A2_POPTO|nr:WUSCHEL-related homeobox 9 [Populus tomentosa]